MPGPVTQNFDLTKLLTGPYYCSGCAGRICEEARGLEGVSEATCDLEAGSLAVTYDPSVVRERDLEIAVRKLALAAEDRVAHAAYRVTGLD